MDLADYLDQASRKPFAWGRHDCCLFAADWVKLSRGLDPMARHRGRYGSVVGAALRVARSGGMVAAWSAGCEALGLQRTACAGRGDIGVVQVMTAEGPAMMAAISTGPRWAVLSQGGLAALSTVPLAAWTV